MVSLLAPLPACAPPRQYDVVVYGATAGGTMAAIAAAEQQLKVALIEPGRHVGGMTTGGLSKTDHGRKEVVGGMSRAFYERLGRHYNEPITWYFEPRVAEQILNDWLAEAGIELFREQPLSGVARDARRVTRISTTGGLAFSAAIFIDASYEGDLMARAGITYTWGREGQQRYGESLAGVRERSEYHQFTTPISPYDADGKLLPFIYGGDPGQPGQGDRKVQAYNYRLCISSDPANQVPFPKPPGYSPARYELLARYLQNTPDLTFNKVLLPGPLPNHKADVNNRGAVSTDHIGASWDYPEASYARRREIWEDHKRYQQGIMYFLANEPVVPPQIQKELRRWGLARDEFVDTDHWPHQLYIREARRMIGEYVMKQQDLQTQRTKPDSIGMGSYNSDSHHVQRVPTPDGHVLNEGDMQVPVKPYEIAYRCMLPRQDQCENLLVPVCVSASHVAYSSLRMEPVYMIMGHAAGLAAARSIREGVSVQRIDVTALQRQLREQRQVLREAERVRS